MLWVDKLLGLKNFFYICFSQGVKNRVHWLLLIGKNCLMTIDLLGFINSLKKLVFNPASCLAMIPILLKLGSGESLNSKLVVLPRLESSVCSTILPIAGRERREGYILFPSGISAKWNTASSRIWTWLIESIFYSNNHYDSSNSISLQKKQNISKNLVLYLNKLSLQKFLIIVLDDLASHWHNSHYYFM